MRPAGRKVSIASKPTTRSTAVPLRKPFDAQTTILSMWRDRSIHSGQSDTYWAPPKLGKSVLGGWPDDRWFLAQGRVHFLGVGARLPTNPKHLANVVLTDHDFQPWLTSIRSRPRAEQRALLIEMARMTLLVSTRSAKQVLKGSLKPGDPPGLGLTERAALGIARYAAQLGVKQPFYSNFLRGGLGKEFFVGYTADAGRATSVLILVRGETKPQLVRREDVERTLGPPLGWQSGEKPRPRSKR